MIKFYDIIHSTSIMKSQKYIEFILPTTTQKNFTLFSAYLCISYYEGENEM